MTTRLYCDICGKDYDQKEKFIDLLLNDKIMCFSCRDRLIKVAKGDK